MSLLLPVVSEADWTCEECSEGGPALGDWLASEDNLMHETDVLLAEVCPRHPEPQYCQDNLPRFWKEVGPVIMREHYSHVCDDLECRRQQRTSVPSCEACTARINRTADFLAAEETIVAWTSTLMEWCANNSDVVQVRLINHNTPYSVSRRICVWSSFSSPRWSKKIRQENLLD